MGRVLADQTESPQRPHVFSSFANRAILAILLIVSILVIGTLGFHYLEHFSYVDAFYYTSMLATAEGPSSAPVTVAGKLFASVIAFVSVGSVILALSFLFGPFMGKFLREEERRLMKDEQTLSKDFHKYRKRESDKRSNS